MGRVVVALVGLYESDTEKDSQYMFTSLPDINLIEMMSAIGILPAKAEMNCGKKRKVVPLLTEFLACGAESARF